MSSSKSGSLESESFKSGSLKSEFSRFLGANQLLHFAAHSHHPWPDVTWEAQQQAWLDAAARVDEKWEWVFAELLPAARQHIATTLELSDPRSLAFAGNTHELVVRLVSCFELGSRPVSVLTTGSEFHSFDRQSRRWQEAGVVTVARVSSEPFESFADRFLAAASADRFDLVFLSHVFFDSGFVFDRFDELAGALADDTFLVVDGYHGFMALPTSWAKLESRAFYLSGGYKYAMAGEGACFLHCPSGYGERPVDTGWYAAFGDLQKSEHVDAVPYAVDGARFLGATFDPTGLYRFVAVMDRWRELGVTVADIHRHVVSLQERFLESVTAGVAGPLDVAQLVPPLGPGKLGERGERGHFLTFEREDAAELHRRLRERDVMTDVRGNRIRFGFGVYQDADDVDDLLERLRRL